MDLETDCPWYPARGPVQVGVDVIAPYIEEPSAPRQPTEENWELGIGGEPYTPHPLIVRELRAVLPRLRVGTNHFKMGATALNAIAQRVAAEQG